MGASKNVGEMQGYAEGAYRDAWEAYELLCKLLASSLLTPIDLPVYNHLYNPPSRSLDYSTCRDVDGFACQKCGNLTRS